MNNKIKKAFTETYKNNRWGSSESFSGVGSQLNYTYNIRTQLERIIYSKKIKTIFDCSCGDWNWMKHVDLSQVNYIGNDIVTEIVEKNISLFAKENIKFLNNDCLSSLKKMKTKSIDLIICRHTLEHLETDYCVEVCNEIKRVGTYALITSNNVDNDIANSDLTLDGHSARRIDLEKPPFLQILSVPVERIWDSKGQNLGVKNYNGINLYYFGEKE